MRAALSWIARRADESSARACAIALLASVLAGGLARAEPIEPGRLPRIRMSGAPIPANGAIVLESLDSVAPVLEVTTKDGVYVPGTAREVGALRFGGLIFAWVPDAPLEPGTYTVTKLHPYNSSLAAIELIEVSEAITTEPPALLSQPSASEVSTRSESLCCMDPVSEDLRPCTVVEQISVIHVEGGLSSTAPASKLNQFLFRYAAAARSGIFTVSERFMPIDQLPPVIFESEAEQYCFVLKALNVATLEEHTYEELPSCTERGKLHVGPTRFEPDPVVLDPGSCPFPQRELRSAWCVANEQACDTERDDGCAQYEHICRGGPLPERWVRMGLPGRIVLAESVRGESRAHDALCSVDAPGRARPGAYAGWLASFALLALARRRRAPDA